MPTDKKQSTEHKDTKKHAAGSETKTTKSSPGAAPKDTKKSAPKSH